MAQERAARINASSYGPTLDINNMLLVWGLHLQTEKGLGHWPERQRGTRENSYVQMGLSLGWINV